MQVNFSAIPEYVLFKELTSLDDTKGRDKIDLNYQPTHFKAEERSAVFKSLLQYYKQSDFQALMDEYIQLMGSSSYKNMGSMGVAQSFAFNHPMVVTIYNFIGQGLLTKDLEINPDIKLVRLGRDVMDEKSLQRLKISEGVIFEDGTLMPIESNEAHKIAAIWLLLNGADLNKAIRYTSDCIHPEPIFTSMSEYANLENDFVVLTKEQAFAIYNIHKANSRAGKSFRSILSNSIDLCITSKGNPEVRYVNVKTLERYLGSDVVRAKDVFEDLRYEVALSGDPLNP